MKTALVLAIAAAAAAPASAEEWRRSLDPCNEWDGKIHKCNSHPACRWSFHDADRSLGRKDRLHKSGIVHPAGCNMVHNYYRDKTGSGGDEIKEWGLNTKMADMECSEAFSVKDCKDLNQMQGKSCTWTCGDDAPQCTDRDAATRASWLECQPACGYKDLSFAVSVYKNNNCQASNKIGEFCAPRPALGCRIGESIPGTPFNNVMVIMNYEFEWDNDTSEYALRPFYVPFKDGFTPKCPGWASLNDDFDFNDNDWFEFDNSDSDVFDYFEIETDDHDNFKDWAASSYVQDNLHPDALREGSGNDDFFDLEFNEMEILELRIDELFNHVGSSDMKLTMGDCQSSSGTIPDDLLGTPCSGIEYPAGGDTFIDSFYDDCSDIRDIGVDDDIRVFASGLSFKMISDDLKAARAYLLDHGFEPDSK